MHLCVCDFITWLRKADFLWSWGFYHLARLKLHPKCSLTLPSFPEGPIQYFLFSRSTELYRRKQWLFGCHFNSECTMRLSNNPDKSERAGNLLYMTTFPKALHDCRANLDQKSRVLLILLSHLRKDGALWQIALPSNNLPFRRQEWHLNNSNQCHIIIPHWV